VVDAQAIHQAFGDQLEDLAVGGFEHRRALDAQAAEFVDVEKAPPVDVVRRGAPAGQAVALALQQLMQAVETFRLRCRTRRVVARWPAARRLRWRARPGHA
jgi:hypothetical protein